jgi:hypothetical protein
VQVIRHQHPDINGKGAFFADLIDRLSQGGADRGITQYRLAAIAYPREKVSGTWSVGTAVMAHYEVGTPLPGMVVVYLAVIFDYYAWAQRACPPYIKISLWISAPASTNFTDMVAPGFLPPATFSASLHVIFMPLSLFIDFAA